MMTGLVVFAKIFFIYNMAFQVRAYEAAFDLNTNGTNFTDFVQENLFEICHHGVNLGYGVCTKWHYSPQIKPIRNMSIYVNLERYYIHSLYENKGTYSIGMELCLYWIDPGIHTSFADKNEKIDRIILSPKAIEKIWTPDLSILNLTNYKEYMDSLHVTKFNSLRNEDALMGGESLIEYCNKFTATTYCDMNYQNYPYDTSSYKFVFGGTDESDSYYMMSAPPIHAPHSLQGDHDVTVTIANVSLPNTEHITNYVAVEISFRRKQVRLMYRYILLCIAIVTTASFTIILPQSIGNLKLVIPVTILLATVIHYIFV